jgi:chemotaxis protein histidine kinase CheA
MRARAERLGGSLVVESTPGQGTTILLGLPVGSSDDTPEPSPSVGPDG